MHLSTLTFHMMLLTLTVLFLSSNAVFVSTSPSADPQLLRGQILPPGYEYAPLRMTGTIGGIVVNHTGTIEQIVAEIEKENPGLKMKDLVAADSDSGSANDKELDKRIKSELSCWPFDGQPTWLPVMNVVLIEGISWLQKVRG